MGSDGKLAEKAVTNSLAIKEVPSVVPPSLLIIELNKNAFNPAVVNGPSVLSIAFNLARKYNPDKSPAPNVGLVDTVASNCDALFFCPPRTMCISSELSYKSGKVPYKLALAVGTLLL